MRGLRLSIARMMAFIIFAALGLAARAKVDHPGYGRVSTSLEALREPQFKAGRYNRSELHPTTVQEAVLNTGADGTRSSHARTITVSR
jgi:hypothetical protein